MADKDKQAKIDENEELEKKRQQRDPSHPASTSTGGTTGNPPGVGPGQTEK